MTHEIDITHLTPAEPILLAEHLQELNRRVESLDSGAMAPGKSWEVVRDRLWRS